MPPEQVQQPQRPAEVRRLPDGDGIGSPLVERDVRRKRPPVLSFLLRWETARRLGRIVSLLVLDFAAVYLAILTALSLKAAARDRWHWDTQVHQTEQFISFAFLVTALLFARSGLYSKRCL